MLKAYILTYCKNLDQLYGTTLVFETLRRGFPNAQIAVFDNCSLRDAAEVVRELAVRNGCTFAALKRQITHPGFLERILFETKADRLVFLDPDMVFWDDCEEIEIPPGKLFGGRLIPSFHDEYTLTITLERIHPSFLLVSCVTTLRQMIAQLCRRHISFSPFAPAAFFFGGRWFRMDTCASLYAALEPHSYAFGRDELERYDHLMLGSQMDLMHSIREEDFSVIREHHRAVREGDLERLKGFYEFQDAYFAKRRVTPPVGVWFPEEGS